MLSKKYKILLVVILPLILLGFIMFFFYFKEGKIQTLKSYYPKTKVTDISEFFIRNGDTIFHGKFIQYNEKGNKIAEGNFVNNESNGKSVYYFENGNIKSLHYRKNNKITQESIYNYPNGSTERYILYDYALFDDIGATAFIIRYDEQGNVKSYDGYPVMEGYQYKIKRKEKFKTKINQYLKVGDTLKYKYLLANIPNATRTFKIENVGLDNKKIKRIITRKLPAVLDVKEVLTKKGLNNIQTTVEYRFNDSKKTVIKDTIYFDVEVH